MRVLSMFDGISCGRVALDRVGIMPEVYFASEIDEYAERVSADNWPDLVRLGDAKGVDGWDLGRIDLLLGGSPCTNWSITKKEGRELTASGTGWELFSFYVKALQKFEPKYFLYENVKSMSPAIRAEITRALGVEPILINSGLVSAQNRERLYWTNIPGVGQPEDRRITFEEILERGRTWREKAYTLRASHGLKGGPYSILRSIRTPGQFSFNGVAEFAAEGDGTAAYEVRNGYITIKGERYPLKLPDGNYRFRKLTKTENCRLQTLPDNYCKSVSDAQACKAVGNGWTVDVIAHILGNIPKGDCYTMKAIVMTTQDAREFEKLGGLTITKPIRPVPVTYCKGLHLMEREPGNWLLVGGDNDVDRAEKFANQNYQAIDDPACGRWESVHGARSLQKRRRGNGLLDSPYRKQLCDRGPYVRGRPGGGTVSRRVYRWRVSPPPGSDFETVEVLGASRYEAVIAAAKLWRTPWTQIARVCTFENLGEWTSPPNCNVCEFINLTEEKQHKWTPGSPHICLRHKKRVYHNSSRPGYHDMIHPCKECIAERKVEP